MELAWHICHMVREGLLSRWVAFISAYVRSLVRGFRMGWILSESWGRYSWRCRIFHQWLACVTAAVLFIACSMLIKIILCRTKVSWPLKSGTYRSKNHIPSSMLEYCFRVRVNDYVRSLRDSDFKLYINSLQKLAPWFFLLDNTNYAHGWLWLHGRDAPDVFIWRQNGRETHYYHYYYYYCET